MFKRDLECSALHLGSMLFCFVLFPCCASVFVVVCQPSPQGVSFKSAQEERNWRSTTEVQMSMPWLGLQTKWISHGRYLLYIPKEDMCRVKDIRTLKTEHQQLRHTCLQHTHAHIIYSTVCGMHFKAVFYVRIVNDHIVWFWTTEHP